VPKNIKKTIENMEPKEILGLSALILSIVNGLMLLKYYLRDRPKLIVRPIHPEVYQWWFKLPDGEFEGNPTRKYGFLAYIDVINCGLRKVSIGSWNLFLRTVGFKRVELKPINIPEPKGDIGGGINKFLPVLGQRGPLFAGDTLVDSGVCISGMAYYILEFHGGEAWNSRIKNERITGKLVVRDVFGKKAHCKIVFSKISLEKVTSMIEGIEKIGAK